MAAPDPEEKEESAWSSTTPTEPLGDPGTVFTQEGDHPGLAPTPPPKLFYCVSGGKAAALLCLFSFLKELLRFSL